MPARNVRRLVLTTTLALCAISTSTACSGTTSTSPDIGSTSSSGAPSPGAPSSGPTSADATTGPLSHWSQALQDQDQHAATWLALGDSITEGQGASARQNRWIDLTTDSLRHAGAGGVGYLPGWDAVWGPDSPWKSYASRTGTVTDRSEGSLGLRTAVLATGATQTYTFSGTSADLYYLAGKGVLGYSVDGGPTTDLSTAGSAKEPRRSHVSFGAAGDHTLTVTARSGTVRLSGVAGFNGDETSGVHLFDSAHSGYTSGQFVVADADQDRAISLVQPDLVTIELGVNDYLKGDAAAKQVRANLEEMIDDLRHQLKTPASIVLVLPYDVGPVSDGAARSWADYAAAVRSLGPELSVGVLDMSTMGTAVAGGNWSQDGLHPSDLGQEEMARRATAYLTATG